MKKAILTILAILILFTSSAYAIDLWNLGLGSGISGLFCEVTFQGDCVTFGGQNATW